MNGILYGKRSFSGSKDLVKNLVDGVPLVHIMKKYHEKLTVLKWRPEAWANGGRVWTGERLSNYERYGLVDEILPDIKISSVLWLQLPVIVG